MHTQTLFDSSYSLWMTDPEVAFSSWLASQNIKKDSIEVYCWMWGKFCRWMAEHNYRLDTLEKDQLGQFINEEELVKKQGYRYVRLIERVYLRINSLPDAPRNTINPAKDAAKNRLAIGKDAPMGFFSVEDRRRLALIVETGQVDDGGGKGKTGKSLKGEAGIWKRERDLALLGMFLGGGLKVHEVNGLTISCILNAETIALPYDPKARGSDAIDGAGAGTFEHQVKLEPFAVLALQRWLHQRSLNTEGNVLFPSSTKGAAMDPSSIFRRIQRLLLEAGLDQINGARSCCQTLRNCFAATHLDRETPAGEIAQLMGFVDVVTVERVRFAYEQWKKGK
ncbi:tyrosine-type recombinase/integrase [Chromobacterium haemolyticum]|uniref:Tyrosine-type recombinase/integrase n=1 Tax=Chromobacterium fluminis TaxID=3044269 RepID=A0ABX0L605_9NEIS|nr:tyrosine-type recombinase/integrase [Chromobacterium haemolyticum]NHR04453.1 tyrosine-type recombinase/integrase [Chromobacterium haemolyticum]